MKVAPPGKLQPYSQILDSAGKGLPRAYRLTYFSEKEKKFCCADHYRSHLSKKKFYNSGFSLPHSRWKKWRESSPSTPTSWWKWPTSLAPCPTTTTASRWSDTPRRRSKISAHRLTIFYISHSDTNRESKSDGDCDCDSDRDGDCESDRDSNCNRPLWCFEFALVSKGLWQYAERILRLYF